MNYHFNLNQITEKNFTLKYPLDYCKMKNSNWEINFIILVNTKSRQRLKKTIEGMDEAIGKSCKVTGYRFFSH